MGPTILAHNLCVSKFVQQILKCARQRKRLHEIDTQHKHKLLEFTLQRPGLDRLCEAVVANKMESAMQIGSRLVGGIVATQVGKTRLQLNVPAAPCNSLIPQDLCGGGSWEPMIKPFATFVWGVHEAVAASGERIRLLPTVLANKTDETPYAGQTGLRWWSKTCNSDKEASLCLGHPRPGCFRSQA